MATHICPSCKKDSFTWSVDEEQSLLTKWGCFDCKYVAYEDESLERSCSQCHNKTESLLTDETKKYWWCSNCDRVTLIR